MPAFDDVLRAAELGRSSTAAEHAELRHFIARRGKGTQDLRCAATYALACALGAGATPDLAALLGDRDRVVRDYAADALYHVGDARAWDEVLDRYQDEIVRRGPRRVPLPPAMPLSYLLIHAGPGSARAFTLIGLLRRRWARLSPFEQQWLKRYARDVVPGGPDPAAAGLPTRERLNLPGALPYGPDR